jgi:hypothetical protein
VRRAVISFSDNERINARKQDCCGLIIALIDSNKLTQAHSLKP